MKKIAIFASGTGTNAEKIIEHFNHNSSPYARVVLIVSNRENAGVIQIARREDLPVLVLKRQEFYHSDLIIQKLEDFSIDLIVLAGFLWKVPDNLIQAFPQRIINIHPALLPAFGGKGMFGNNVHTAVIESGKKETGITIHYVDGHYDNGDIIFQAKCEVLADDTPETLAKRVHQLEHLHFSATIEKIIRDLA